MSSDCGGRPEPDMLRRRSRSAVKCPIDLCRRVRRREGGITFALVVHMGWVVQRYVSLRLLTLDDVVLIQHSSVGVEGLEFGGRNQPLQLGLGTSFGREARLSAVFG